MDQGSCCKQSLSWSDGGPNVKHDLKVVFTCLEAGTWKRNPIHPRLLFEMNLSNCEPCREGVIQEKNTNKFQILTVWSGQLFFSPKIEITFLNLIKDINGKKIHTFFFLLNDPFPYRDELRMMKQQQHPAVKILWSC